MPTAEDLNLRQATPADAEAIAVLHAESWRRYYRGAYSDSFLDGDVRADRLAVWTDRLREPDARHQTILAADRAGVIAFAHTVLDHDPVWGALLDNLHVAHRHKRRGVGSQLLTLTARAVIKSGTGLYLWVQEQNLDAQAFYAARGAQRMDRAAISPPGGVASRLNGTPLKLRYGWPDPSVVLR